MHDQSAAPQPKVGVCVLTYDRNDQLAALLEALSKLDRPDADVRIVIVDNSSTALARPVVDAFRARTTGYKWAWPIGYVSEPERGIAGARNRAVSECADVDFVVFIDDDEIPQTDWLASICAVQAASKAPVVVGRVVPRFDSPPPKWIVDGEYFSRPRHATGQRVCWAITGNVMIARALLTRYTPPFDERFNLSGGEDTHFFMRARDDGTLMVSADDAVVFEDIPEERTSWRWIMRREYRRGNTLSLCMRDLHPGVYRRLRRAVQSAYRIVQGVALLTLVPFGGRCALARAAHRLCLGAGLLTGLLGFRYEHYVHEHRHNLARVHSRI
ncbi:MAG TPA: glycosyltransferase [Acidimicrobiia bacterium]|jgi:GT2 family glycosyltransferase|nr:glycosyltransferase [Acidimicrobiia bacterium]